MCNRAGIALAVCLLAAYLSAGGVAPTPAPKARQPATTQPTGELLKPIEAEGVRREVSGRPATDPRQAIFRTAVPEHPLDVILARPTATSIVVSLLAYADSDAQILYGTRPGDYSRRTGEVRLAKDQPNHLRIAGLSANTRYFYRVHLGPPGRPLLPREECEFHTARPEGAPFTFTVQADSHLDGGTVPTLYANTLGNVLADKPDFHLELGDTFMNDKYPSYRDALRQYVAQRYYFGLACKSVPLYLVIGNHDGEGGWRSRDGVGMREWSTATRRKYFANPYPDGFYGGNAGEADPRAGLENYYAWEWGDGLFVVLDPFAYTTERGRSDADGWCWTLGRPQYDWLAKTVSASTAKYKFVFLHHLVGGSGKEARGGVEVAGRFEWGGKSPDGEADFARRRPGWGTPIHDLLVKHHVSAVFHGHDHLYARQALDGIAYLEVPQPSHPADKNVAKMSAEYGYVEGTLLSSPGHVRVGVKPDGATVEYVRSSVPDAAGNAVVADSFVIPPHKE